MNWLRPTSAAKPFHGASFSRIEARHFDRSPRNAIEVESGPRFFIELGPVFSSSRVSDWYKLFVFVLASERTRIALLFDFPQITAGYKGSSNF